MAAIENKFKVGDRVRGVAHSIPLQGKIVEGVIVELDVDDPYLPCRVETSGGPCWLRGEGIQIIDAVSSPLRTVTRVEIVPGTYGAVTIYDDHSATVDCLDADIARAAAKLFNELADVLDENAKEAA